MPAETCLDIHSLTPDHTLAPKSAPDVWPVLPTDPPILIPALGENDTLYPIEKIEAHIKGIQHLALSVFVVAGDELLIQRRALHKYHCGGQWANTCCTHPHFGEDLHAAALRRLREELGFQVPIDQQRIVDYSADVGGGLWENERVHMFRADVKKDNIVPKLNPDEVCDIRWIEKKQLRTEIQNTPENFTPWMRLYIERYPDLNF